MRKIVLLTLALTLILCLNASLFAGEQVIKFSTSGAPDHPNTIALMKFVETVNKQAPGRLKIELFPANQLGNGKEVIENVMTGSIHMFLTGTSETSLFQTEFSIMDAPYLFRDYDHLMKAARSDAMKEVFEKIERNRGIKILTMEIYYGARHLTTRNKPIKSPADLKGMLIRAPGQPIYLDAVRAMGATPTPVAFSDLYMALKQGVVDGQENPIPTIYAYKYYEAQKYLMLTGHMLRVNVVGCNAAWYKSLSDDLKQIMEKAMAETVKLNSELTLKEEKDMLVELKKLGMIVIEPDVPAFRAAMKDIPSKWEDKWGKGLYEKLATIK